jgi:hypothetical protein
MDRLGGFLFATRDNTPIFRNTYGPTSASTRAGAVQSLGNWSLLCRSSICCTTGGGFPEVIALGKCVTGTKREHSAVRFASRRARV